MLRPPTLRSTASDLKQLGRNAARTAKTRLVQHGARTDEVVFVAGSPRSGTTWVSELLDHDGGYRYLFEPLEWHHRGPRFAHFHRLQYLRPGDDDPSIATPIEDLLAGRVFTAYSDAWDPHPSWRPRHRLMIKGIRSNLILGWIADRHPEVKIVLIVRHPLAVIASRAKLHRSDWATGPEDIDDLLAQPDLVKDFLGPHLATIESATDPLRRQLVMWCIEQMVPMRHLSGDRACVVRYEDLLMAPQASMVRLTGHLGHGVGPSLSRRLATPSATSWNGHDFVSDRARHANQWRDEFSRSDLEAALELMDEFGLGHLYTDQPVSDLRDRRRI